MENLITRHPSRQIIIFISAASYSMSTLFIVMLIVVIIVIVISSISILCVSLKKAFCKQVKTTTATIPIYFKYFVAITSRFLQYPGPLFPPTHISGNKLLYLPSPSSSPFLTQLQVLVVFVCSFTSKVLLSLCLFTTILFLFLLLYLFKSKLWNAYLLRLLFKCACVWTCVRVALLGLRCCTSPELFLFLSNEFLPIKHVIACIMSFSHSSI